MCHLASVFSFTNAIASIVEHRITQRGTMMCRSTAATLTSAHARKKNTNTHILDWRSNRELIFIMIRPVGTAKNECICSERMPHDLCARCSHIHTHFDHRNLLRITAFTCVAQVFRWSQEGWFINRYLGRCARCALLLLSAKCAQMAGELELVSEVRSNT